MTVVRGYSFGYRTRKFAYVVGERARLLEWRDIEW